MSRTNRVYSKAEFEDAFLAGSPKDAPLMVVVLRKPDDVMICLPEHWAAHKEWLRSKGWTYESEQPQAIAQQMLHEVIQRKRARTRDAGRGGRAPVPWTGFGKRTADG